MSDTLGLMRGDFIRVVKVIEDEPGSFPLGTRKVYKCLPCKIEFAESEGATVDVTPAVDVDRAIYAGNIRHNYVVLGGFYMVYRVNGLYVLDNQMTFLENM